MPYYGCHFGYMHYTKMRPSSPWFHYILSEFEHFYYDEIGQPLTEWGSIATDNELVR
jgi:hypothetical protein